MMSANDAFVVWVREQAEQPCRNGYTSGCLGCTPCVARDLLGRYEVLMRSPHGGPTGSVAPG